MLPDGYQERLRKLVEESRKDAYGNLISLSSLAFKAGKPYFKATLSSWLKKPLERRIKRGSFEMLSKMDKYDRTPQEIELYLEGYGEKPVTNRELLERLERIEDLLSVQRNSKDRV